MIAAAGDLKNRIEADRFVKFVTEEECEVFAHPETIASLPQALVKRLDIRGCEYIQRGAVVAVRDQEWP